MKREDSFHFGDDFGISLTHVVCLDDAFGSGTVQVSAGIVHESVSISLQGQNKTTPAVGDNGMKGDSWRDRLSVNSRNEWVVDLHAIDTAKNPVTKERLKHEWAIHGFQLRADLPEWVAALTYAKAAHRACSNFAFVAWDVALTDQGPQLLEGNATWSPGTYQHLRGEPLGHTKFAAILATRLESTLH